MRVCIIHCSVKSLSVFWAIAHFREEYLTKQAKSKKQRSKADSSILNLHWEVAAILKELFVVASPEWGVQSWWIILEQRSHNWSWEFKLINNWRQFYVFQVQLAFISPGTFWLVAQISDHLQNRAEWHSWKPEIFGGFLS